MSRRYGRFVAATLATLLAVSAAGCGSDDGDNKASAGNGGKVDKVSHVTAFGAVGRDAMVWVAKEKGYFKEAGIEVDIVLGAGTDTSLKAVTSGQAQFAMIDMTGSLIQAGNGKYDTVKTIAAVHQQTLVSIMSVEGSGITQPKDLVGKKLGAATASVNQLLFPAYAKLAGFDDGAVEKVNLQPTQLGTALASNQVNAVSTFLIGRQGLENATKKKITVLPYSDYLRDLFGNALITSDEIATKNPDLAKRYRDALLKGLKYTIENPEEAADIMIKDQKSANKAAAVGEITSMTPYVKTPSGAIGVVDEAKVNRAIAILQGAGLMPAGLKADKVVAFDLTPKV
jgi:NitT/TauT family transport system substrate-binding protein